MASINIKSLGFSKRLPYVYKDFKFDIEENSNISSSNLYKDKSVNDIQASTDLDAIRNSVRNMFNTLPRQKLLDPTYGLDLRQFLFIPVDEDIAQLIGDRILEGFQKFEPRVVVRNINVIADEENQEFIITLTLDVPDINAIGVQIPATLGNGRISV